MSNFDEEVQVFYDRFDKAYENNDIQELGFFSQFTNEPDIRKWTGIVRRRICENARNHKFWLACGLTGVKLNEYGWLEWKIPGYENQEFIPLGCIINRGCCNTKEDKALGILQLPNGKWIAQIDSDFTNIGHPYIYLDIFDEQYETKTEAWNNAIKRFVDWWHNHNKGIKKEDEAVIKAKSMIKVELFIEDRNGKEVPYIHDGNNLVCIDESANINYRPPKMKGEPIQLSLF